MYLRVPYNGYLGYYLPVRRDKGSYQTGSLFYSGGKGGVLSGAPENSIGPGGWLTLEVIADGNHLVAKVNGNTTADVVHGNGAVSSGHIAICARTGVEFRKIEIKELP